MLGGGGWALSTSIKGWKMIGDEVYALTGRYRELRHEKELAEGSHTGAMHTGSGGKDVGVTSQTKTSESSNTITEFQMKRHVETIKSDAEELEAQADSIENSENRIHKLTRRTKSSTKQAKKSSKNLEIMAKRLSEKRDAEEEKQIKQSTKRTAHAYEEITKEKQQAVVEHVDTVRQSELDELEKTKDTTNSKIDEIAKDNAATFETSNKEALGKIDNPFSVYTESVENTESGPITNNPFNDYVTQAGNEATATAAEAECSPHSVC